MRNTSVQEHIEDIGFKGIYPTLMKVYNQQYSEIKKIPLDVSLYLIQFNISLNEYIAQEQERQLAGRK